MQDSNSKTFNLIILFSVIILTGLIVLFFALRYQEANGGSGKDFGLDSFAQCLAEKEVKMYGAEWCSHCKNQKELFGRSFQYVPYVECPEDTETCTAAGVEGYPTWIFADGSKKEGEVSLETLAEKTDCELPGSKESSL